MTAIDRRLVAAWQGALAAEHRAVFGYPLLGVRLAGGERSLAASAAAAHADVRDRVSAAIGAAGLDPVPSEADYPSLHPVPDAAAARRLAVGLETGCCTAWRYLYARAAELTGARPRSLRTDAQSELSAAAVRAVRWRMLIDPARATTAFPGL